MLHLMAIFLVNFLTELPEHGTYKSRSSYQILSIHYAFRGGRGYGKRLRDKNGKKNVERKKKTSPFVSPAHRSGELFLQRCRVRPEES